jgi:DNA topoisomerase-1
MSAVEKVISSGESNTGTTAAAVDHGPRKRWWRRSGTNKRTFKYFDAAGNRLSDKDTLARIDSLVIPPAWKDVRIAPSQRSAVQAVGVDKLGRIQYLYSQRFRARQEKKKYAKLEKFGEVLPSLRSATNEHISGSSLTRERVLAVIVRLINDLYFRLGSEKSVKRYRTYGVTTLRNRHLEIKRGGKLCFSFVGKHHIKHRFVVVDKELAALVREIKEIGGSRLFNYFDADGKPRPITPRDVNEYIKAATSNEFSAKDFRTWGGTLKMAVELAELGRPESEREAKTKIVKAVKRVSEYLGNTPAVCRSSYVHPIVIENFQKGITIDQFRRRAERAISRIQPEYEIEEVALIKLLKGGKA